MSAANLRIGPKYDLRLNQHNRLKSGLITRVMGPDFYFCQPGIIESNLAVYKMVIYTIGHISGMKS